LYTCKPRFKLLERRILEGLGLQHLGFQLGQASTRKKIVRRHFQDVLELGSSFLKLFERRKSAPKRDARRQKRGMVFEPREAHSHGLEVVARPSKLLCQGCKSNRRRILLDPASKYIEA
jgi:hypothetical protein